MQPNTVTANNFKIIFQKMEEVKEVQGKEIIDEIKMSNEISETISLFRDFQEQHEEYYLNFTRS